MIIQAGKAADDIQADDSVEDAIIQAEGGRGQHSSQGRDGG